MKTDFQERLTGVRIYNPSEICEFINDFVPRETIKSNKKIEYYNIPASFDIETTSFYQDAGKTEKAAIMYEWTLGINGGVLIGRTWAEYELVTRILTEELNLHKERRLVLYVHNLGFEFQFIRKLFEWEKVFSIDVRNPLYALDASGIEYRCSYMLSGYSLAALGNTLKKYPVRKMEGDLDYKLKRNSVTPLTPAEIQYCVNDVKVVMSYIQQLLDELGNLALIPLTKTGFVRKYCKDSCFYIGKSHSNERRKKHAHYSDLMQRLRLNPEEYEQLKRAFQGGFTHANAFYSGKTLENVGSYDFTSSYPAVMIAEKFPMSSAEEITINSTEDLEYNLSHYCCMFDVEIEGLDSRFLYENPLSVSRCSSLKNVISNNGRVVSASSLITTVTEQDFKTFKEFYTWENIKIYNFKRYRRGYLPTDFVKAIIKLYQDKTQLKNVKGRENEYARAKEMINSCYGMIVTDVCRDTIIYSLDNEWSTETPETDTVLDKYNKSRNRFLFYPWGVWVTAYARRNLFTGIRACGNDYVYSDTDSIKILNYKDHTGYINAYNDVITDKLNRACEHHGIDPESCRPKTIKGVSKPLGVWDFEGVYTRFKTLGAKRYIVEENGEINITVSGVNKRVAVPYLLETYPGEVFEHFNDQLYIPPEVSGKNIHTYIDDEKSGYLTDYLGNTEFYDELSGVHLVESDYHLSISKQYADYLRGIQLKIN